MDSFCVCPAGGAAELQLRSHPGGSLSGFTTVQIPVTPRLHKPAETTSSTSSISPSTPAAGREPAPIISGVVSGEAAQRALSDHSVNLKSGPSQTGKTSPQTTPTFPEKTQDEPAASVGLEEGQREHVPPADCQVCGCQYEFIMELRGFMCLCSPEVALSLKMLKKKKMRRRSQHRRSRMSPRDSHVSRTPGSQSGASASKVVSPLQRLHPLSEDFTSPAPLTSNCSPSQQDPLDSHHGKLVILVDDFYYGSAPGRPCTNNMADPGNNGPYNCIHCQSTLNNNMDLMGHMRTCQRDRPSVSSCPHCYRHFSSSFRLRCHLEAAHGQCGSSAQCQICELAFSSETAFLWHMKSMHKPGEMPYTCQVCDFRSSFYSDLLSHFDRSHKDSKHLLCLFCLRVMSNAACYQQHISRHQRKHVFSCDRCRLHFLYVKERIQHKLIHHRTHIRPAQLTGLKPGTKVTVRMYSVIGRSETEEGLRKSSPCKVVDVGSLQTRQEAGKRKLVESLGGLLTTLSPASGPGPGPAPGPAPLCVECLSSVQDFRCHFPSLVRCSLCSFITCCCTAYANHMINNHAVHRAAPQYSSLFLTQPRLLETLKCVSCSFTTCRGDVMANHLTEKPEHCCIMLADKEPRERAAETRPTHTLCSVKSSGAFIPIHLLPSGHAHISNKLSVKLVASPSPLSSPPVMTITFLGPRPQPEQNRVSPMSCSQLSVVLFALCHGLHQASLQYQTSPLTIRSWIQQEESRLSDRKWLWRTGKVAEWVLGQREQQLEVNKDVLLQTARTALGEDSSLVERYSWSVDFLLRHELSLQPVHSDGFKHHRGRLPRSIRDRSRSFIHSLSEQIHGGHLPPHCLGCMDEFSVFIDRNKFCVHSSSALQLLGSSGDKPVFNVVLCALSNGVFLPPLLFYKGNPSHVPEGFPDNVLLEARQEGFTNQERHEVWISKVWRPHVASQCKGESVLMVDIHQGHLTDEFRGSLSSMSTDVVFIPSGCSSRLQPLDVCVTPVLRDFLQAQWTQLVSVGGLDGLGLDQLALTLACWFSEVCFTLNTETHILRRSFASACDLQEVEQREEAARMIHTLREVLVQPLETSPPEPEPEPELELMLVMEEEKMEEEEMEEKEMEEKMEEKMEEEEMEEEMEVGIKEERMGECEEEALGGDPSALLHVLEEESDQETFDGFMDD